MHIMQILPEEVEFRKIMTNVTAYRLKTVQQNEDVSTWDSLEPANGKNSQKYLLVSCSLVETG